MCHPQDSPNSSERDDGEVERVMPPKMVAAVSAVVIAADVPLPTSLLKNQDDLATPSPCKSGTNKREEHRKRCEHAYCLQLSVELKEEILTGICSNGHVRAMLWRKLTSTVVKTRAKRTTQALRISEKTFSFAGDQFWVSVTSLERRDTRDTYCVHKTQITKK